jgi:para-nitrobenzyl esterase
VPPHSFRTYEDAIASGRELKARYGVETVEELRALPAETIVGEADTQHYMTVDGYALTETPYESYKKGVHNEEAILHGYNSEESAPFLIFDHANLKNYEEKVRGYFGEYADEVLALYNPTTDDEAKSYWAQIYSAVFFNYPHYCLQRLAAANGIPVYEYYFTKHNGRLGPWHSGEEVYCYGNIPADSRLYDESDRALADIFSSYVANFARSGDPNGEGLPVWGEATSGSELLELGATVAMRDDPFAALYPIMDSRDQFETKNR